MTTSIFICGVGGQGIGLMGEVLCHVLQNLNTRVMATETHGVAQRGGTVTTHIRFGDGVRTPKIGPGEADFVFSLERLEGLRFTETMLRDRGTLVYYDTVQQPQVTRARGMQYPTADDVNTACQRRNIRVAHIALPNLQNPQMQNVALLGRIAALQLISGVTPDSVRKVLHQRLPERVRALNLQVFNEACTWKETAARTSSNATKKNGTDKSDNRQGLPSFPIIAGA